MIPTEAVPLKPIVLELAKKVYRELGSFGYVEEKVFERALAQEFRRNGLSYLEQVPVDILYEGHVVLRGVVDFIVFDREEREGLLLELKAQTKPDGAWIHQIVKYYEALTSEESTFPRFIVERIRGGVILNWTVDSAQKGMLVEELGGRVFEEREQAEMERLREKIGAIEVYNLRLEKTREEGP